MSCRLPGTGDGYPPCSISCLPIHRPSSVIGNVPSPFICAPMLGPPGLLARASPRPAVIWRWGFAIGMDSTPYVILQGCNPSLLLMTLHGLLQTSTPLVKSGSVSQGSTTKELIPPACMTEPGFTSSTECPSMDMLPAPLSNVTLSLNSPPSHIPLFVHGVIRFGSIEASTLILGFPFHPPSYTKGDPFNPLVVNNSGLLFGYGTSVGSCQLLGPSRPYVKPLICLSFCGCGVVLPAKLGSPHPFALDYFFACLRYRMPLYWLVPIGRATVRASRGRLTQTRHPLVLTSQAPIALDIYLLNCHSTSSAMKLSTLNQYIPKVLTNQPPPDIIYVERI